MPDNKIVGNGGFDYDNRDNSYKLSTVVGNK